MVALLLAAGCSKFDADGYWYVCDPQNGDADCLSGYECALLDGVGHVCQPAGTALDVDAQTQGGGDAHADTGSVDDVATTGLDVETTTDTGGTTADAVEDASTSDTSLNDTTTGEETTDTGTDDTGTDDTGTDDTGTDDTGTDDTGTDDTGTDDTGGPFDCAVDGEVGCPCEVSADCDSNVCLIEDGVCSDSCSAGDDCPDGMDCVPSGSDGTSVPVQICAPKSAKLCQPCTKDADCAAVGEDPALPSGCVEYPGAGAFCAVNCFETFACPAGYTCQAKTTIDGVEAAMCVRTEGLCQCNKLSIKLALTSACEVTNALGSCGGIRTCTLAGLTECDAAAPEAEVCDGVDNDCNGLTDDGLCDDGIDCTVDECIKDSGKCESTPDNSQCAQNLDCTTTTCDVAEGCKTVTDEAICEDGDQCTTTVCDPEVGCQTTPVDEPCDDGSECTVNDTCVAGKCEGAAPQCNDSDPCTADSCEPAVGCVNAPVQGACDDGNKCTTADTCVNGDCVGTLEVCDDGKPCTYDVCDSVIGCTFTELGDGTFCDDGDNCTASDNCLGGVCVGTVAVCVEESINIAAFQSSIEGAHPLPGGSKLYPTGAPALAALPGNRFVTHWAAPDGKFARITDAHGSRENEELAIDDGPGEFNTGIAASDGLLLSVFWNPPPTCGPNNCDISVLSPKLRVREHAESGALKGHADVVTFKGGSADGGVDVQAFRAVPVALSNGNWLLVYSYAVEFGGLGSFEPEADLLYFRRYAQGLASSAGGTLAASPTSFARFDAAPVGGTVAELAVAWVDATQTAVKLREYLNDAPVTAIIDVADEAGEVTSVAVESGAGGGTGVVVMWTVESAVRGRLYDGQLNAITGPFAVSPVAGEGDQRLGDVGVFSDGGFVAVYDDENGDSDGFAVMAQRFNKFGTPAGAPLAVSGYEPLDQVRPSLAVLADDQWAVAFVSGEDVWTRRFAKDGSASSGRLERRVNATVQGAQSAPAGAFVDGGALVAFVTPIGDAGSEEIRAQRVNGQGEPEGPELLVNEVTNGTQSAPAVAAAAGRFAVAWETEDTDGRGVALRVYDAGGEPLTGEIAGNAVTAGAQRHPAVAVGSDGVISLLWDGPAESQDVSMRRFSSTGAPLSADIVLNTATGGPQEHPAVASLGVDALLVVWESRLAEHAEIMVGRATGTAATGDQTVLNVQKSGDQTRPAVAANAAGDKGMACWESDSELDVGLTVVCRAITIGAAAAGVGAEFTPHVVHEGDQRSPGVAAVASGFVIAWETPNVDGDLTAVQYQLRSATGDALTPRVVANRSRLGSQNAPFVAADGPDSFMVGWQTDPAKNGSLDVLVRVFPVD